MPVSALLLRTKVCCLAVLCLATVTCGGGSGGGRTPVTPTPPTTPTTPTTPVTPVNTWSAAGRITAVGTSQAIGGATLTPGWALTAVSADAQGNYELGDVANPPSTPYPVTVTASGYLNHDVWITWARGPRTGVDVSLIRNAAPFSMDFYQQFIRDTFDKSDGYPWRLLRWTTAPSFYVRTVDQNGKPIEPEVLAVTLDAIRRAVPAYTGGVYAAAAIETGTEARPQVTNWINVDIKRDPAEQRVCGRAFVGANPGLITLNDDVCSCGSRKIPGAVTMHEVGHALGFFHVSDRNSLMYPFAAGDCPAGELSSAEAFHAKVAYSRPRGNTDPDKDPVSGASLTSMSGSGPLVR